MCIHAICQWLWLKYWPAALDCAGYLLPFHCQYISLELCVFWHWTFFTALPWKFATRVHWLKFVFINSNWVFLPLTVNSIHTYIYWISFDEKHLKERKQKIFKLNHLKYIKISTEIEISVETFQIEIFNGTPNFWTETAIFVFILTANAHANHMKWKKLFFYFMDFGIGICR